MANGSTERSHSIRHSLFATRARREDPMFRTGDGGGGGGRPSKNVLGDDLQACSLNPVTGFFRNGCCDTSREDVGSHTVCAVMTDAFLAFSKARGNDLSTPL